ncbi:unnamed protein product [Brugia timori]|uniref:DNA-binding protein n=1 Tax=Brugia timori TaxID=42155 RepID=A0A0R3R8N9_9BILA|nr:unnamed protein product [Brugia timori]
MNAGLNQVSLLEFLERMPDRKPAESKNFWLNDNVCKFETRVKT